MITLTTPISIGEINRLKVTHVDPRPDLALVTVQPVLDSGAETDEKYRLKIRNGRCEGLRRRAAKDDEGNDRPAPRKAAGYLEPFDLEIEDALDQVLRAWHSGRGRDAALLAVEQAGLASWLDNSLGGAVR